MSSLSFGSPNPMKPRRFLTAIAAILAANVVACSDTGSPDDSENPNSTGTTGESFPDPDPAASEAPLIVVGTVLRVDPFKRDVGGGQVIDSIATIKVEQLERGSASGTILVWTAGGKIGDLQQVVSGNAWFEPGARVRVFLDELEGERLDRARSTPDSARFIADAAVYQTRSGDLGMQLPEHSSALHSGGGGPENGFTYNACFSQNRYWFEWKRAIRYYVNPNTPDLVGEERVVRAGFDAWEEEPSSRIDFAYAGTTTSTTSTNDGINIVFWTAGSNLSGPNIAAEARLTCWSSSGEILDADIAFNDDLSWSLTSPFFLNTAIHEAGHVVGLGHINDTTQIMHPSQSSTTTLGWGDRNGVRALYPAGQIPAIGDFDGDGLDDIVAFINDSGGDVWVALNEFNSTGKFGQANIWNGWFAPTGERPLVGDFNRDGLDDIITFTQGESADVYVCLSNGVSGFTSCDQWHSNFAPVGQVPGVGDFDGDGNDDIVSFTRGVAADVHVALSNGVNAFGAATKWHEYFVASGEAHGIGDLDEDGDDDLVAFVNAGNSSVWVALSNGVDGFGSAMQWHAQFCGTGGTPIVAELYGDNRADIICRNNSDQQFPAFFSYALANASGGFGTATSGSGFFAPYPQIPAIGWFPTRGSLLAFQQCSTADVFVRSNGLVSNSWGSTTQWHDWFAPGPCP